MNTRLPRVLVALALVGAIPLTAGCFGHRPGGNMSSNDFFTYESTPHMPMTVTLVDTRDETEFWSVDVPVGQKLVLGFHKDRAREADFDTPDLMRWEIYPSTMSTSSLRNAMSVPPSDARRIDLALRDQPEYPEIPNPTVRVTPVAERAGVPMPRTAADSSTGRRGTYYRDGNDPANSVVTPGTISPDREGVYYSDANDE